MQRGEGGTTIAIMPGMMFDFGLITPGLASTTEKTALRNTSNESIGVLNRCSQTKDPETVRLAELSATRAGFQSPFRSISA